MAKPGPKPKEFSERDIDQLKVLARCHCPDTEIAAWFGVSERTIQRQFGALLKEAREAGRANLRAMQYKLAMAGDKTMLVWLGKQLLKQSDRNHFSVSDLTDDDLSREMRRRMDVEKQSYKPLTLETARNKSDEEILFEHNTKIANLR